MPKLTDPTRTTIRAALTAQRRSMLDASVTIGRNPSWLQQYLERGTPRVLPEKDRLNLAILLQLDERCLGARDPYIPAV